MNVILLLPKKKCLIVLLLGVFLILSSTTSCSFRQLSSTDIYEKHEGAVVLVRTYDYWGNLLAHGTGFNIEPTGTIVTNYHVIEDAYNITVDFGTGTEYEVEGYRDYDEQADLIVLDITVAKTKLPTISLAESTKVKVGEEVYVIGNPLGVFDKTFSTGVISQVLDSKSREFPETIFQLTAPVSPGSSGSPVLNKRGEVLAVIMASVPLKYEAQNINFAVPVNYVGPLLASNIVNELEAPQKYDTIRRLELEADSHMVNGEYIEAINLYTEIINLDPENRLGLTADAYSGRSTVHGLLGLNEKSLEDINKALEMEPDNAGFYNDRGCIYADFGRYEDAIIDFSKAINLDSVFVLPYANRADAYCKLGLYEKAIVDYTQYIDKRSDTINKDVSPDDVFYNLYLEAIRSTAAAYYNRGRTHFELGQRSKAVDDFKKALELDPTLEYAKEALKALRVPGY